MALEGKVVEDVGIKENTAAYASRAQCPLLGTASPEIEHSCPSFTAALATSVNRANVEGARLPRPAFETLDTAIAERHAGKQTQMGARRCESNFSRYRQVVVFVKFVAVLLATNSTN